MGMMVMLMVRERVLVLIVMAVRWRLLLDDIALVVDAKPNMNCIIQNPNHDRDYNPQIQMRSASSLSTAASTLQRSKSLAAADRLELYLHDANLQSANNTQSEKPRQRVSNADRKVFPNPESFCKKLIIG